HTRGSATQHRYYHEAGDWTRDGTYMYPGSLTVSADAFVSLYVDLLRSLHDNGLRRVFLVSGHFGGRHLKTVARVAEEAGAGALLVWRKQSTYIKPDDWVFDSGRHRGRHPFWGQAILRKYVRPIAEEVGIQKCIGWHTFRHTYSTLLLSVGTEFKVMQ